MKFLSGKYLILTLALAGIMACGKKIDRPTPILSESDNQRINEQAAQTTSPLSAAGNLSHYYCPNMCEGSGGDSAGICPVCGTNLVHNDAFHNQPQPAPAGDVITSSASAGDVWHYTCPNGHPGAAQAGVCTQCGATLEHNQEFHNQPTPATTPPVTTTPGVSTGTTSVPEPAQNAAGVWHYICPNGHDGGGGPGACATCGTALEHNAAYHN